MAPVPLSAIASYHAHVYFDGPEQRVHALWLREEMATRFSVALGRIHDRLIGPHARPMYQVSFANEVFAAFVPWLMLNRGGLSILVHPNTAAERDDHLEKALWLGERLPILHAEGLAESNEAQQANPVNTNPHLVP